MLLPLSEGKLDMDLGAFNQLDVVQRSWSMGFPCGAGLSWQSTPPLSCDGAAAGQEKKRKHVPGVDRGTRACQVDGAWR